MTPELPAYCENPTLCVNCGSSAVCPPWALCHRCLGDASQPRMPSDPDADGQLKESTTTPRGRDVETVSTSPPKTPSNLQVGVRGLYSSGSKYARRGLGNGNAIRPLPEPTAYPPGTVGKLLVLESRAMAGVALWHPADAGFPPDVWK